MMSYRGYYYLVITIVLLNVAKCSVFGTEYFSYGKLWKPKPVVRNPEDKWIEQKLDHFDSNEDRTWKQRYFVSEELVNEDRNVAFLNIGGESEADKAEVHYGAWYSYAKKFGPILFKLEHRYYGASRPTENLSTKNLKYLSSKQALADLAVFIQSMNKEYNLSPDVKWIVFGYSYAGSLAAWARLLYPDLVHGVVSSSGPVLAKADFYEYYMVVADGLRTSNEKCLDIVQKGFKQLEELLNDTENRHKINEIFNLHNDIESLISKPQYLSLFFYQVALIYAAAVQSNYELHNGIDYYCGLLLNETSGSELDKLGFVNRRYYGDGMYIDYNKLIKYEKNEDWNSVVAFAERQWIYQTCTEFGFYQTSSHEPHVFGHHLNVDYFIQQCIDIHGPEFNKTFVEHAVAATNDLYHGLDINVTNIVYIHGSLDPWHPLGVTESYSEDATVIMLEGASHCTDINNPSPDDSLQLQQARVKIEGLISHWLKI